MSACVGFPQFSAVLGCIAAKRDWSSVITDGGIPNTEYSVITAGADCDVGITSCGGTKNLQEKLLFFEGRKFKSYRGMGSVEAMEGGSKTVISKMLKTM
jgi:IMP dehydrogenase